MLLRVCLHIILWQILLPSSACQKPDTHSMHHLYAFNLQLSRLQSVSWLRSDLQPMSVFFTIENTLSRCQHCCHVGTKRKLPVLVVNLAMSPQKESILVETCRLSQESQKYLFTKRQE